MSIKSIQVVIAIKFSPSPQRNGLNCTPVETPLFTYFESKWPCSTGDGGFKLFERIITLPDCSCEGSMKVRLYFSRYQLDGHDKKAWSRVARCGTGSASRSTSGSMAECTSWNNWLHCVKWLQRSFSPILNYFPKEILYTSKMWKLNIFGLQPTLWMFSVVLTFGLRHWNCLARVVRILRIRWWSKANGWWTDGDGPFFFRHII